MADEQNIARYRHWYRKLLRCYPRPYRERFAESMEQTFSDLLRERARAGGGLFRCALWVFVETSVGIVRENVWSTVMEKGILRIAIVTGCIMLVPVLGSLFVEGWNWGLFDFVILAALLFGTGLAYELISRKGGTAAYRIAVGMACATGFLLVFINAAVGIIGDGLVNLLYFGVLAVGFIGAFMARFEPRGMSLALFATAVAQILVPVIALAMWEAGWHDLLVEPNSPHSPFDPGIAAIFGLNGVFAVLFVASALLFRRARNRTSSS
jgi:hypothetical protein